MPHINGVPAYELQSWNSSKGREAEFLTLEGRRVCALLKSVEYLPCPKVKGLRLGNIPPGGRSYNYRDGHYEAGVSVVELVGWPATRTVSFATLSDRPTIEVEGLLAPVRGSDGEPLILVN